jgi:hypothetical protein
MAFVYVFSFFVIMWLVASLMEAISERFKRADRIKAEYERKLMEMQAEHQRKADQLQRDRQAFEIMYREKSLGFPWLATAFADYLALGDLQLRTMLMEKRRPAIKAAEVLREASKRRVKAERLWRILRYKLDYYESLFPWLVDFDGEELDDLIRQVLDDSVEETVDEVDPVCKLLTSSEFRDLPTAKKNQLALDRYLSRKKTNWEIGRDYERYIGHHFAMAGWNVQFHGITEGFADLGRDLIAIKGRQTVIVQCKCWAREKQIHEKHVFQLFGSVEEYKLKNSSESVHALLVTTTALSDLAKQFAQRLNIDHWDNQPLVPYPMIKCNVSHRDAAKIYHLPFDQQYDRTTIDEQRHECYVQTVAEAEHKGFRRAWRWHGLNDRAATVTSGG